MADGPLRDVRILDLTHVWAGPLGTRILADFGAQVVKIEAAGSRGPREGWSTPMGGWIGGEPGDEPWNRNAIFVKLARNAGSVCLDLKNKSGRETFLELVKEADVVIENFSARVMPGLDLDYQVLKSVNPSIIYVTMPGFGTYGPYRDRVAFGPTVEPMSGITNVMGYSKSEPRNTAMALVDAITAVSATAAVVTALRERERSGEGQYVEMSLHECGVSFSGPWLIEQQLGGQIEPIGNRHPSMAPHGVYQCKGKDEWLALGCSNDGQWAALCRVIGNELDPAASLEWRRKRQDLIDRLISNWTGCRTKSKAAIELQEAGVCAGPVNTTPDMTADEQVLHRGFFVPLDGGVPMPGNPVKMSGSSSSDWQPSPGLGADNVRILKDWLGYSDSRIQHLVQAGILNDKPPA